MRRRELLVAASAALLGGCVTFHDADLLPVPDIMPVPTALAAHLKRKTLPVQGRRIALATLPANAAEGVLIAFGGNSNSASSMLQVLAPHAAARRLTLMVPSYFLPGEQPPTVAQLRAMADAVYAEAATAGLPVFVLGFSVGCWVAIELASRSPVRGLLLAGSGTTVEATFAPQYFPLNWMLDYRSDADLAQLDAPRAAMRVAAPTLVVASDGDTVTPAALGREVFAALPPLTVKRLLMLHGVPHGRTLLRPETWEAADSLFGWRAKPAR